MLKDTMGRPFTRGVTQGESMHALIYLTKRSEKTNIPKKAERITSALNRDYELRSKTRKDDNRVSIGGLAPSQIQRMPAG